MNARALALALVALLAGSTGCAGRLPEARAPQSPVIPGDEARERTPVTTAGAAAETRQSGPPTVPMTVDWRFTVRHFDLFPFAPMEFASPVVEGEHVYVASSRAKSLYALRRSGGGADWIYRVRARVEATPAIGGGRVYVADAKAKIHAVDQQTGERIWISDIGGIAHARLVYDRDGGAERVVAATGFNRVYAYDATNGAEAWVYRRDAPADLTVYGTSAPVKATVGGKAAWLVGFSDGWFVALNAANGTPLWETRLVTAGRFRDVDGTAEVVGDRVYVSAFADAIYALDLQSGKLLWGEPPGGATGIVHVDGKLVHGTEDGFVIARTPADGRELWRWKIPGGVPTTPVPAGNLLFLASSTTTLYALYPESGSLAWTFEPDYRVSGSWAMPTVAGDRVFFFTNAGSVYAFEPASPGFQYIGTWDSGTRRD